MESCFNPSDPADLRRQAYLYRRLAGLVRDTGKSDRLIALAVRCEELAEEPSTGIRSS
jgi:hypothetical protein